MNKIDIENIKEILKVRKYQPEFQEGGDLSWEQITSKTTEELEAMVISEERKLRQEASDEIKKLVDEAFAKFSEEGSDDNMIALGSCCYYDDSRHVSEAGNPINDINFDGFGHKYNKLAYPIGRDWDIPCYRNGYGGQDKKRYEALQDIAEKIIGKLPDLGLDSIESYWEDNNEAINECWYGVHAITKDYMVVAFVIRDDGMLCDEDSLESHYNHILVKL